MWRGGLDYSSDKGSGTRELKKTICSNESTAKMEMMIALMFFL